MVQFGFKRLKLNKLNQTGSNKNKKTGTINTFKTIYSSTFQFLLLT